MGVLIGHTGYVGTHLSMQFKFDHFANSTNIEDLRGIKTDFLVCAGLPAFKGFANANPEVDSLNMERLWKVVSTIEADRALLISTVDVYAVPNGVYEFDSTSNGVNEPYGNHRAEFERRFSSKFQTHHILRLPGLFSNQLRKNLIFDLINKKFDQLYTVNGKSTFQYFNMELLGHIVREVISREIELLNVASEPISANEVASIFGIELSENGQEKHYDMRTIYADLMQGSSGYLFSKATVLQQIRELAEFRAIK